jgi:BirA family biotin operon repressor/biotin-[acetyl-CoA-carboxylase] ligase
MTAPPRIFEIDEVNSTNDEARRMAAAGAVPPFWVRADRQTAGRGRRGRSWVGLAGNLFLSGLYRLSCPPAEAAQLSFAAALAVGELLDGFVAPERVAFKWPNDVKLDGAKAAGVLLEASAAGRGVELVVGIGVNLADAPEGAIALVGATGDDAPPPADAGRTVVGAFEAWRVRWAGEGFAPIRAAWLARAEGLGGPVAAELGEGRIEGVFEDLDLDGALVMMTAQGRRLVRSGEVFFSGGQGAR